jgi:hypothetical protein
MKKFRHTSDHPKLNQEDINQLKRTILPKEIEKKNRQEITKKDKSRN